MVAFAGMAWIAGTVLLAAPAQAGARSAPFPGIGRAATPAEIRDNPAVIAAYLGVEEDDDADAS